MTGLAINRYSGFGMTWSLGTGIVCLVTTVAIRWSSGITGNMTKCTVNVGMSSCQRENSVAMVEGSAQPVVHVVTNPAIGRELGSHMIFRPIILNLVARNTIRFC